MASLPMEGTPLITELWIDHSGAPFSFRVQPSQSYTQKRMRVRIPLKAPVALIA